MVVARISVEQIIEVYAVREALDGAAARLAATHAQILDLHELELINSRLRELAAAKRHEDMAPLNLSFHDTLARASRNQMLYHFIQEVLSVFRRFKTTTFTHPGRGLQAVEEHDLLLAALRTRDPDAAERIARQHMHNSLDVRIQLEIRARTADSRN
jgi:DNA-binding GntR family transcriptional regulator